MKPGILALVVFLAFILCAGVAYKVYKHNHPIAAQKQQNDYLVRVVETIADKADEFNITLANGDNIHASLAVHAIPKFHKEVVEFIGSADSAKVVIIKKKDNDFVVDIILSIKGAKDISLSQWLTDSKFVYGSKYE